MKNYLFLCNNDGCESREVKLRTFTTSTRRITKICSTDKHSISTDEPDNQICPTCGGKLTMTGETTNFIGTFQSMSPAEKRNMLTKRSHQHMNSGEMKDKRREMDINAHKNPKLT